MDTFKVASGDTYSANAKNCAQFFTPCPQSSEPFGLPAGHATEIITSRLIKCGTYNRHYKKVGRYI